MILVTGATGFVGSALIAELGDRGYSVRGAARTAVGEGGIAVGSIGPETDWREALRGVDTVIHTIARSDSMAGSGLEQIDDYRKINTAATLNLARQAATASVKRFVFLSSIKVNGEYTDRGKHFSIDDVPRPSGAYAISKWEAEQGLDRIARDSDLEIVIIRPPLVYGPGARANFDKLVTWIRRGVPLPFGAIGNKRSFIALDNLLDLIICCMTHPAAGNQTFLASDGEDLSTAEFAACIARGMNKPLRLISLPAWLLKFAAGMLGRSEVAARLCSSLQIDLSATRERLGWKPPVAVEQAVRNAVLAGDL